VYELVCKVVAREIALTISCNGCPQLDAPLVENSRQCPGSPRWIGVRIYGPGHDNQVWHWLTRQRGAPIVRLAADRKSKRFSELETDLLRQTSGSEFRSE